MNFFLRLFDHCYFKYCVTELSLSRILVILCLNNQTIDLVKNYFNN
jgi:hypothetical protein